MAIPKVYLSSDAGAPVMNNTTAGSAVAVARACLVDGYGSKAPAGWTEEFTGTNKAAFRNSISMGGTGCYVRIDDAAVGGQAKFELRTFAAMTGVDAGTDGTTTTTAFRAPADAAGDVMWFVVATGTVFYLAIANSTAAAPQKVFCGAGDLISNSAGDAYRYFSLGHSNSNEYMACLASLANNVASGLGSESAASGLSVGRSYTGIGGAIGAGFLRMPGSFVGGTPFPSFPSANSADAACMPAYVAHGAVIRGRMPGVYIPLFNTLGMGFMSEGPTGITGAPGSSTLMLLSGQQSPNLQAAGLIVETALDWGD